MRSFRPPNVERATVDTVLGPRGDKRVHVGWMDIGLGGSDKPCSHANASRAGRERSGHRTACANAAGSENSNVGHGLEHLAKQMHQPDSAANMAAGLDPLRDNYVASHSCSLPGLVGRPHLPGCQRAMVMDNLDELRTRITVEELNNPGDLGGLLDALARAGLRWSAARSDNEVYSEWATGQLAYTIEKRAERGWIEAAARGSEHAQAAGFGNSSD